LSALRLSTQSGRKLSQLVADLPPVYTISGRLRQFPRETGRIVIEEFRKQGQQLASVFFEDAFGRPIAMDFTDGARITFSSGEIVHLRPSGNAPEFRCYTEASTAARASTNNEKALSIITERIRPYMEELKT
jgi:phosphomannomutase